MYLSECRLRRIRESTEENRSSPLIFAAIHEHVKTRRAHLGQESRSQGSADIENARSAGIFLNQDKLLQQQLKTT